MAPSTIRTTLFVTFVVIFVATAALTLLAITGVIEIREGYLNALFASLILETVAAVIALFRSASFFADDSAAGARRVVGAWWELISNKPGFAVSFVLITTAGKSGRLRIEGEAFDAEGRRVADWKSFIAWLDPESLQLVYLWSGNESAVSTGELTGLGLVGFRAGSGELATRGFGWFVAPGAVAGEGDTRALVEMRRASEEDRAVMLGEDRDARARLVAHVHAAR